MPLLRTFDAAQGKVVVTLRSAFLDKLSRWSDIQEYMPLLYEEARSRPGCRILELGARRGCSTLAFLAGATESGGHVWSCDIDDVRAFPDGIGPWGSLPSWTFTRGDDTDPDVQAQLPAECDVLFIDTSHHYRHTLDECRAYVPRVARGGIALFHDTNLLGYDCAGAPRDDAPAVWQALDVYCAEAGFEWENLPGTYGLGVIRL